MEIPLEAIFSAFGLEATVTNPGSESSIETTIVWLPTDFMTSPQGGDAEWVEYLQRKEPRQVMALKRAEVGDIALGTRIDASEVPDGEIKQWTVAAFVGVEADLVRVAVRR